MIQWANNPRHPAAPMTQTIFQERIAAPVHAVVRLSTLHDFLHGPHAGRGQGAAFGLKMDNHVLDHFAQIRVHFLRIIPVNSRDQIGTLADVRPIYHEQIGDAIRVEEQVWGGNFSWMHNRMGPQFDIPGYLSMYCAYVDGQPACTGWTYFNPNTHFASLWGGSTIPEQRKNGLYTAVLAVRIQEAIRRGYRFVFSDATAMSRAVVEQHGFQVLTSSHEYELPEKA